MMRLMTLCFAICLAALPARAEPAPTMVHAAASLQGVLQEALATYEGENVLGVAGSGVIARQVVAGLPADLVILASPDWMDWVLAQGVSSVAPPVDIAANALVVIGPEGDAPLRSADALPARLNAGRLAMGHRDAVPAGVYARQWLQNSGVWDQLADDLAETDNVRAALALVIRGEAPLGIVYASDAQSAPQVDVLYQIPDATHDPIRYPALALSASGQHLLEHLRESEALFRAHGFRVVAE